MSRVASRPVWKSFLILFSINFACWLLIPPTLHVLFGAEKWRDDNFADAVVQQLPWAIVIALVVAGITMIERRAK